jgi:hypothetical protein
MGLGVHNCQLDRDIVMRRAADNRAKKAMNLKTVFAVVALATVASATPAQAQHALNQRFLTSQYGQPAQGNAAGDKQKPKPRKSASSPEVKKPN